MDLKNQARIFENFSGKPKVISPENKGLDWDCISPEIHRHVECSVAVASEL
jgi:hypothetical protein